MINVLFFDGVTPKPYNGATLLNEPMGGTEATVIRIATRLAKGFNVFVAQHNATETTVHDSVVYGPIEACAMKPNVVVCLREPGYLKDLKETYPEARLVLWCHDLPSPRILEYGFSILNTGTHVLGVSHWHSELLYAQFISGGRPVLKPTYIYNPISDTLGPLTKEFNPHKLVFMSSPHKGLGRTLEVFKELRKKDNRYELHLANPGYLACADTKDEGVVNHGPLTHDKLLTLVSDAVGVLHLNKVFPETFGIVHAEANALGVPFLTDFNNGAVQELIDHPGEMINTDDTGAVITRIQEWSEGRRPKVRANGMFRLSRVIDEWYRLIRGTR